MNTYKVRSSYIDVVKVIAITLVVMGHCIQNGLGEHFLLNKVFIMIDYLFLFTVFICHYL